MRQQRGLAALIGVLASAVCMASMVFLGLGATAAGASTRLRSGSVHAQSAGRASPGAASLVPAGAHVMAGVVAVLAVLAVAYLVVTFIRRRVSVA